MAEAHYFRNWHFCYRWAMMGRTSQDFRRAAQDMARKRVQDILSVPLRNNLTPADSAAGPTAPPTICEIFNSERLVAILLRWHVNMPGYVIVNNRGHGKCAQVAEQRARTNNRLWSADPEAALSEALVNVANDAAINLCNPEIRGSLPTNNAELRHQRDFTLFTDDLP